jgi:hypothetical protein
MQFGDSYYELPGRASLDEMAERIRQAVEE